MGLFKSRDEKKSEEIYDIIIETLKNQKNQVYDLKVECHEGVVTLSGVCDSEATRKKVIICAELAEGVKKVNSDPLLLSESAVKKQSQDAPPVSPAPPAAPSAASPVQTAPTAPVSESPAKSAIFPAEVEAAELKPTPEPQSSQQAAGRSAQPSEPVQPQADMQTYTIKAGDTLSKIAKQFYGQTNKYMVIFEANRDVIKDPDRIYPGQTIHIPPLP